MREIAFEHMRKDVFLHQFAGAIFYMGLTSGHQRAPRFAFAIGPVSRKETLWDEPLGILISERLRTLSALSLGKCYISLERNI